MKWPLNHKLALWFIHTLYVVNSFICVSWDLYWFLVAMRLMGIQAKSLTILPPLSSTIHSKLDCCLFDTIFLDRQPWSGVQDSPSLECNRSLVSALIDLVMAASRDGFKEWLGGDLWLGACHPRSELCPPLNKIFVEWDEILVIICWFLYQVYLVLSQKLHMWTFDGQIFFLVAVLHLETPASPLDPKL